MSLRIKQIGWNWFATSFHQIKLIHTNDSLCLKCTPKSWKSILNCDMPEHDYININRCFAYRNFYQMSGEYQIKWYLHPSFSYGSRIFKEFRMKSDAICFLRWLSIVVLFYLCILASNFIHSMYIQNKRIVF